MTNLPAPLLALSVQEPWSTAILDFGKDVENREWHRSPGLLAQARRLVGRRLMLHAGKTFDDSGVPVVRALTGQRLLKADCTLGAVLGVITIQAVMVDGEPTSGWAARGAVHLHVAHPVRLTDPIPCRGALGFFCPDDTVQERVRRQLTAQGVTL
ncbi:hypothetical protein GCM10008959_25960 [Deinococcus seoulensis]|uniref:ASCH domain-containing protein n=1 Tax=Deinococcus seoulensis TaxID=1837379 RepID=A0ABQ2RTD0_9DEIO|nr:hypothetical protein [Deinococcus seoulensis]GGR62727.1 hypothetical protein GCM10008959_25960 [Deinococcus seoulensis]